ncbi:hypothetical protein K6025_05080 [Ehrlichia sp. JZT12]
MLIYRCISKDLDAAVRIMFESELKKVRTYPVNNNTVFADRERSYGRVLIIFCNILYQYALVKSVKYSVPVVYRLSDSIQGLIHLYIAMHNRFVLAEIERPILKKYSLHDEQSRSLEKFLSDISDPVFVSLRNIRSLCTELISGSDFMGKGFVVVAACVYGICFYSNKIEQMFVRNIRNKRHRLNCNNKLNFSAGIYGESFIDVDCLQNEKYNDSVCYKDKLAECCSKAIDRYHAFLLEGLNEQHGIKFEELLSGMAKILTSNSEGFFPRRAFFVCNGQLFTSSTLTKHGSELRNLKRKVGPENESEKDNPCKRVCSSQINQDPSNNSAQQSFSESMLFIEDEKEDIEEELSFIVASNDAMQRSCDEAAFLAGGEGSSQDFCSSGRSGSAVPHQSYNHATFLTGSEGLYSADSNNDAVQSDDQGASSEGGGNSLQNFCFSDPSGSAIPYQSYNQATFLAGSEDFCSADSNDDAVQSDGQGVSLEGEGNSLQNFCFSGPNSSAMPHQLYNQAAFLTGSEGLYSADSNNDAVPSHDQGASSEGGRNSLQNFCFSDPSGSVVPYQSYNQATFLVGSEDFCSADSNNDAVQLHDQSASSEGKVSSSQDFCVVDSSNSSDVIVNSLCCVEEIDPVTLSDQRNFTQYAVWKK